MELNLMPEPAKCELLGEKFRLTETFSIGIKGKAGSRLYKGANRTLRRLAGRTGFFFPQDFITPDRRDSVVNFLIECKRMGQVKLNEDEKRIDIATIPGAINVM